MGLHNVLYVKQRRIAGATVITFGNYIILVFFDPEYRVQ